jgi:multidrug/hemolysin transport system ATP-binding protein
VDLVRGLIHDPKILFLDEPTTGLDPLSRQKLWSYIKTLRETSDTTIFLTTHYLEETESADHVVIMKKGSIIAEGTPTELKNRYTGRKIVWYTEENPEHEGLLEEQRHSYELDHYNIFPQGSATDFLWAHRGIITDYEVVKGSMDEVFLAQG